MHGAYSININGDTCLTSYDMAADVWKGSGLMVVDPLYLELQISQVSFVPHLHVLMLSPVLTMQWEVQLPTRDEVGLVNPTIFGASVFSVLWRFEFFCSLVIWSYWQYLRCQSPQRLAMRWSTAIVFYRIVQRLKSMSVLMCCSRRRPKIVCLGYGGSRLQVQQCFGCQQRGRPGGAYKDYKKISFSFIMSL